MKNRFRKILAAGLAVLTAVSLAACGGGEGKDNVASGDEFVYVPSYVSLDDDRMSNPTLENGKLYYTVYNWDEETGSSQTMYCYDVAAGTSQEVKLDRGEAPEDANPNRITADSEGNLYVVWELNAWDEFDNYTRQVMLAKYDTSGTILYFRDITDDVSEDGQAGYIQYMAADSEGRAYLVFDGKICLFDDEGKAAGKVELNDTYIQCAARGRDGKVYVAYYNWNGTEGGNVLAEVDFAGRQLGTSHTVSGNLNNIAPGLEKDFLLYDGKGCYEYDLATDTREKLLSWLDSDINGDYVEKAGVMDGKLTVVIRDWGTGKTELAFLKKTKASELAQKEEIVVGAFTMSQELKAAAVNFNKTSDKFHITVREYYDYNSDMEYKDAITNMNNEITSGKCPDILDLSNSNIKVAALAEKGILADLNSFLDSSSVLNRDSFVESALKAYTYGDVLVGIPKNFMLSCVAAKTSQVGDRMGWSMQDIIDFAAEHPDAELIEYASQAEILSMFLMFNQDSFIDWGSGTCNFNSEEFKKILEFAAGFPAEYNYDGERVSTPTKLATGKLLLYGDSIRQCEDIQVAEAMFNEPVTWIGYPTLDGSMACLMDSSSVYGITEKSKQKEGAWIFLESFLTNEDEMFSWGFSSRKDKLEEDIAEASKVEYVTDENGEIVLDENGDPIISGMGGFGYDDWEYTYHPCTEEEIETLRMLIDVAIPMPSGDEEVLKIISEEADPYFQGQKSLDEVVDTIQSRMSMYVGENS